MASVGKIFKLRQKFANHKRKDWQSDYIIITGFVHQQNKKNTQKIPHQDWQDIFNTQPAKNHYSEYMKNIHKSIIEKTNCFTEKKGRKNQIDILSKRKYDGLKYMKICLASLGIRKIKFKP